ncbi:hypothetical protein A0H81_01433 [Grifola frondosa]|uniref:Uncharacterized protein n=1 Tax=Grifola frondosa TaxID=5627 RepID=A0A1C7MT31_GRIFR|nr:hypothetical protein A0H81_01433 [Grifola frondosa]
MKNNTLTVIQAVLKVEPMSPNLMFEKMTEAPGLCDSTSVGTPEAVAHGLREIPGTVASPSMG